MRETIKIKDDNRLIKLFEIKDIELLEHKEVISDKILLNYNGFKHNDIDYTFENDTYITYHIIINYDYYKSERLIYRDKKQALDTYYEILQFKENQDSIKRENTFKEIDLFYECGV